MNKIFLFCNTFSLFAGRSNCNVSLPLFGKSNRNFRCLFWCSLTLGWSIGQIGLGLMVSASNLNTTIEKIKRNIKYKQQKHNNKSSMPVNLKYPEKVMLDMKKCLWKMRRRIFLEQEYIAAPFLSFLCRSRAIYHTNKNAEIRNNVNQKAMSNSKKMKILKLLLCRKKQWASCANIPRRTRYAIIF